MQQVPNTCGEVWNSPISLTAQLYKTNRIKHSESMCTQVLQGNLKSVNSIIIPKVNY